MYCVNENAKAHFAFFFNFSFCHSFITYMGDFGQFSKQLLDLGLCYCVYYVNENLDPNHYFAFFFQIFNFSFCHAYITHTDIFHQSFLRNNLI